MSNKLYKRHIDSRQFTLRTIKLLASSKDVSTASSPPPSMSILEFHIKNIFTDMRKAPYTLSCNEQQAG